MARLALQAQVWRGNRFPCLWEHRTRLTQKGGDDVTGKGQCNGVGTLESQAEAVDHDFI